MRTPRNREEFEANKKHFNEYVLQKKKFSIAREVMIIIKPRKNWYEGIDVDSLIKKVLINFKVKGYRKNKISKASIYNSVKDLNLYRDDIYIVSDRGLNKDTNKIEYRYFCPYEEIDINRNKELLHRHIFRNSLKDEGLAIFETEIAHEEELIPLKHYERNKS